MSAARVVVVGGGLAGITAALALTETGHEVTLLEARPRLGGATYSFERDGRTLDNGQHVFLRCCTAYQGLLRRLGQSGNVTMQDRFDVPVLAPGRPPTRLRRDRLPGPLHLTRALAGYPLLTPAERLRAAGVSLALGRLDPADPALDRIRLGDWLAARGQGENARRALWDLFVVASLNVPGDDAPLGLAAKVVQTALLDRADAADLGVPAVPLGDLHGRAAALTLAGLGARVLTGAKAAAVQAEPGGGHRVLLADPAGQALTADGVVLAVPPADAAGLVPVEAAADRAAWAGLGGSPIVNLHVVYDRKVMDGPFAAVVRSPVQWVFDRTRSSGSADGQYLAVSLSAADAHVRRRAAELRAEFVPALAEVLPRARDARVREFFVTKQRQATFRQIPGTAALRPGAATGRPGLVLAGAWTDTGWPDTMEGAVRSGLTAARVLRASLRADRPVREGVL